MAFCDELKEARQLTGLSQQALAERMEIPKRTYEAWEMGERTPPAYVQRFLINELKSLQK